jgi:zinc transport system permease protein
MIVEMLALDFFQRALVAGVLMSLLCGTLSVFVVLRRMAFIGVGISHSAFGGVALGFLFALNPLYTAVGFSILVALLIEWVRKRSRVEEDAAIGIFFAAAMAFGVILLHLSRTYNVDLFGFLFGNILAIGKTQVWEIGVVAGGTLLVILAFFKELVFLSFDEEMAWISGVPVSLLRYLFLAMMALAVVISIYLAGIILVSALLVIPGAVARNLTQRIHRMVGVSTAISLVSTAGGLMLSYAFDIPSGATIVLLLAAFFFATTALGSVGRIFLTGR